MSQQKVDKYKEEKKNRSKLMKKEKLEKHISFICITAVTVGICVWLVWSVVDMSHSGIAKSSDANVTTEIVKLTDEQREELIKNMALEMTKPKIKSPQTSE